LEELVDYDSLAPFGMGLLPFPFSSGLDTR